MWALQNKSGQSMKDRLTFRQVEVFQAIMHFGNVTRAAEYLQVSQPAVSRTIADLQEAAGFVLFRRTRKGMQPTPEAEMLMNEVRGLFVFVLPRFPSSGREGGRGRER